MAATILDNRGVRLKATRYGLMLYYPNDAYIGRSFDLYGEFSEGEIDLFGQLLRPGMVVLDIGANIGAHTLYFANAIGQTGRVIAFEPQRMIYQMLCANLALNGITNADARFAGVGRDRGTAQIPILDYRLPNNFGGISLEMGGPSELVDIVSIDTLGLTRCDFLKIDVEGMEERVLAGATLTIRKFRPLLYVENDRMEKSALLIERLLSLDYELFWHLPPLFNPKNFFGQTKNVFEGVVSVNMLGVPREAKHRIDGLRAVTGPEDRAL